MTPIEGLADIAGQYDGMLIDQFGVLHDGRKLYPGSLGVLAELHRLGIPVVVMTNSGRRAAPNVARLTQMGIPRDHFVDAVSSGEVANDLLRGTAAKRAFIVGREGDDYGFDFFDLVARPQEAEVILILGSDAPSISLEDYGRLLNGVTAPAICCNPDKLMLTTSGLQPAPGAIAALYEARGGKVRWIGKPYREIYDYALRLIGRPQRVLCIGDSAEHDVAGGRGAGLATLLIRTGVSEGQTDFEPAPDYLMERFIWR
ncbi:MAG TPA: TIGR01459 family HAD-type hydrolase [Nordella sp.]|nr:TIGR01459 family HAD-type hydrolase [Nordella sp.]